jgi:FKBP-type peptidyl-prolyl cis-trans isomerase FkpA
MKKYLLGFTVLSIILSVVLTACFKDPETTDVCTYDPCAIVAPPAQITEVEQYLADTSITDAVKHCSGMYYRIITPGTGAVPVICSQITVNYKVYYKNGTILEQHNGAVLQLFQPINGWKNGLPLIHKGGKIELFIPPALAYGSVAYSDIPANSMLIFEIELVDVQ